MSGIVGDIRHAARTLARSPGFTVVSVLAFALGIGANTAIVNVVDKVLLRPLPFPEPHRLVSIWQNNSVHDEHKNPVTPADFIEWRDENHVFDSMAAYLRQGFNLSAGGRAERVRGTLVSADFFRTLRTPPALGRGFLQDAARAAGVREVVVSHALWQRSLGGASDAIGRSLTLNSEPFTGGGVMPPGAAFPAGTELWALARNVVPENPFLPADVDVTQVRGLHYFSVIGRLEDGVALVRAQAEMDTLAARQAADHPESNAHTGVEILALHESLAGDARPTLLIFLAAVGMVLLIACANVANMSLAKAATRRKEIAIRTALGAGRLRLLRQCLTESLLLALLGGGAGLLVALWGTDLLWALAPQEIPRAGAAGAGVAVLGFALALSLTTGVLSGLAPALQSSGADPRDALEDEGRASTPGRRARRLRDLIVVGEVAVALVLLAGAGLLLRSFVKLQRADLGLDVEDVLTLGLWVPDARYPDHANQVRFYDETLGRIAALPGVLAAGATNDLPLGGADSILSFAIEGRPEPPPGESPQSGFHQVSPGYFGVLGIPLLRGRSLAPEDSRESPSVVVISEAMARRYWPGEDPVGRRISYGTDAAGLPHWTTIVGIVGDVRQRGPHVEPGPEAYISLRRSPSTYVTLVVRSAIRPEALAASARRELAAVDPEVPPYDVRTMREVAGESLAGRRFHLALLAVFAATAVAMAAIGLYGVMSYMVSQRVREIGVRMALGAPRGAVLGMVVAHGARLAAAGGALGLAGALALTRLMSSLLVDVSAVDPATFAGISLLLAGVTLLASWIPARRAARLDPLAALRQG